MFSYGFYEYPMNILSRNVTGCSDIGLSSIFPLFEMVSQLDLRIEFPTTRESDTVRMDRNACLKCFA